MKKTILVVAIAISGLTVKVQAQNFDSLTATGNNKKIEWTTSDYGDGYGHKIYSLDPGGKTLLNIAARHNNSSWTDIMTFTSEGRVGIGTTNPRAKLEIIGRTPVPLRVNSDSGNGFTMDVEAGQGLVSLVAGAEINNTGSGYNFINGRGASKISLHDGQLGFYTSNETTGAAGQSATGLTIGSQKMIILNSGYVGIGTANPDEKLTVKGKIHAEEIRVDLAVPADYVFQHYYTGNSSLKDSYTMPTLEEVAAFTKKNHHLPAIPSATQIQKEGLHLKQMTNLLLQKIEELTIYTIEQEERMKSQEERIKTLEKKLSAKKS